MAFLQRQAAAGASRAARSSPLLWHACAAAGERRGCSHAAAALPQQQQQQQTNQQPQQQRQPNTDDQQQHSLRGPPCFTLEASVGALNPHDLALLATGAFGAEVHPDLPIATTWHGLYKALVARSKGSIAARRQARAAAAAAVSAAAAASAPADAMAQVAAQTDAALAGGRHAKPVLHVATVGAQLRGLEDAADSMCYAAGVTPHGARMAEAEHAPHADALLLVSGSHPVRQLPLARVLLPGSVQLLQRAQELRRAGVLPPQLALWAVANPVLERDASYTEQKVAAGASVILTQPPLDWTAFEAWMDDALRRGLPSAARLVIGFPCLSSASTTAFWLALCQASGKPACKQLEQQFRAAEAAAAAQPPQQPQPGAAAPPAGGFAQDWNRQLLARLQATPGVAGLHVMPIGNASKRLALQLVQEGGFARAAWPLAAAAS